MSFGAQYAQAKCAAQVVVGGAISLPAAAPGTFLNPQAALNLRYVIQCPARPPGLVQLWIMRRLRSEGETIGGPPRRINP